MKTSTLCMLLAITIASQAEKPNRWQMFWQNHKNFNQVAGAEDYALQITTNQYALDDLSQELSRGVTESRRKEVLQEISDRKKAVVVLEEQIASMQPKKTGK